MEELVFACKEETEKKNSSRRLIHHPKAKDKFKSVLEIQASCSFLGKLKTASVVLFLFSDHGQIFAIAKASFLRKKHLNICVT